MKKLSIINSNALIRKIQGYGYNYVITKIIWINDKCSWNCIQIRYGIRRSEKFQNCLIWNTSNNCQRSLLFGFGFKFFETIYSRKQSFNQKRKLFFRKRLWRIYQLFI